MNKFTVYCLKFGHLILCYHVHLVFVCSFRDFSCLNCRLVFHQSVDMEIRRMRVKKEIAVIQFMGDR